MSVLVPKIISRAWPTDTDNSVLTSIVPKVLPIEKVNELKNNNKILLIFVVVEPDGPIAEVGFIMSKDSPLASVPVDSYYEMENQIKSNRKYGSYWMIERKTVIYGFKNYCWLTLRI